MGWLLACANEEGRSGKPSRQTERGLPRNAHVPPHGLQHPHIHTGVSGQPYPRMDRSHRGASRVRLVNSPAQPIQRVQQRTALSNRQILLPQNPAVGCRMITRIIKLIATLTSPHRRLGPLTSFRSCPLRTVPGTAVSGVGADAEYRTRPTPHASLPGVHLKHTPT